MAAVLKEGILELRGIPMTEDTITDGRPGVFRLDMCVAHNGGGSCAVRLPDGKIYKVGHWTMDTRLRTHLGFPPNFDRIKIVEPPEGKSPEEQESWLRGTKVT